SPSGTACADGQPNAQQQRSTEIKRRPQAPPTCERLYIVAACRTDSTLPGDRGPNRWCFTNLGSAIGQGGIDGLDHIRALRFCFILIVIKRAGVPEQAVAADDVEAGCHGGAE